MEIVVLVVHLLLALAIIGLVLIQRSEGGGLGIGGGSGGMGGLATAGGTKDLLTRSTAICAGAFFCTSLLLGILAGGSGKEDGLLAALEDAPAPVAADAGVDTSTDVGALPEGTEAEATPGALPTVPVE